MADKLETLFQALSLEEMADALDRLTAIHGRAVAARKAELRAELAALEGKKARANKPDGRSNLKVTHRGPNGETWKGKGVYPKWLQALVDKGKKADDYRV